MATLSPDSGPAMHSETHASVEMGPTASSPDPSATTISTPHLSAQKVFGNNTDLDEESELSSLHTTPASTPKKVAEEMTHVEAKMKHESDGTKDRLMLIVSHIPQEKLQQILTGPSILSTQNVQGADSKAGAGPAEAPTSSRKTAEAPQAKNARASNAKNPRASNAKNARASKAKGKSAAIDQSALSTITQDDSKAAEDESLPIASISKAINATTLPQSDTSQNAQSSMGLSDEISSETGGLSQSPDEDLVSDQYQPSHGSESPHAQISSVKGRNKRAADPVEKAAVDKLPPAKKRASTGQTKGAKADKYYKSAQGEHPEPYGKPPVWADKRQALCQALPYFKAYNGGTYTRQLVIYGLLIDKEGSSRDVVDEEVVITRVGGGKDVDENGKRVQTKDRDNSTAFKSFRASMNRSEPVAIIAGQGNPLIPSKLPHYYNVLAWFQVTDLWTELTSTGVKMPMVRLEKINLAEKSWWAAAGTPQPDPDRDFDLIKTVSAECSTCQKTSQEIYAQGWTCLQTDCEDFFKFRGVAIPNPEEFVDSLTYNGKFVQKRSKFLGSISQDLVPKLPEVRQIGTGTLGCESWYIDGVVCPKCSACCRRIRWDRWPCENKDCGWELIAPPALTSVQDSMGDIVVKQDSWCNDSLILKTEAEIGQYTVVQYTLPGPGAGAKAGSIWHFQANDLVNRQPNGPNDLFREIQEIQLGLKRTAVRNIGTPGEMLVNHFYMNYGAPYKFVAQVDSKAFSQAPPFVLKALMRMRWAGCEAVEANNDVFEPFNETMAVAYMETGSMGYHDDGESTLGPTVSSLSLGCTSTMRFRPKKNTQIGDPMRNQKGTRAEMVKIVLEHGDLIVMHGADIQKFYEHEVETHGKLRFALTARHIVPAQIPNHQDREKAIINGTLPDDIDQYAYDGDRAAQPIPLTADEMFQESEAAEMTEIKAWLRTGTLAEKEAKLKTLNDMRKSLPIR